MVNQAFIIIIAYRPRRRKIPGIGRYPMGPTKKGFRSYLNFGLQNMLQPSVLLANISQKSYLHLDANVLRF